MRRIKIDDKSMINAKSDLNILVPFKYPWAWKYYKEGCKNSWFPEEIAMSADIKLWKSSVLTDVERTIIKRNLGFFSTADSLVANNLVLAVYKLLSCPEARQFLLLQAFQEAVHTESYQHIIESLGMDEAEVFNMYHEIPCVASKAEWALKYTESICNGETHTEEGARRFLRDLIVFYVVFEGIFFYCGFAQILSMGRRGLMTQTCQQFNYIMRDEISHMNFGVDVINTIKAENPHLWDSDFKAEVLDIIKQGVELETQYALDTMGGGILGMSSDAMAEYLQFIANRRCEQIGVDILYPNAKNPFPWISEMLDLNKETNFFEKRVTEYQAGGGLSWDD